MHPWAAKAATLSGFTLPPYNNGTWALPARLLGEQYHCDPWVTVMTGLSGIRVIMMPNGLIYYFFNDAQAFPLADQIEAANQVRPFCS